MVKTVLDLRPNYPAQTYAEYQPAARRAWDDLDVAGQVVELDVICYVEDVDRYDLDVMKNHLLAKGASEVIVRIQTTERSD